MTTVNITNINTAYAQLRTIPPFKTSITISEDIDVPALTADNIDVDSSRVPYMHDLTQFDRRFEVFAMHKGRVRRQIDIGRLGRFSRHTVTVVPGRQRLAPKLILKPAVSAVAGVLEDRNFAAAITAINALFSSAPNDPRLNGSHGAVISRVVGHSPDPSRVMFRLAQLLVGSYLAERMGAVANIHGALRHPVHVTSTNVLLLQLTAANAGNAHFLPIDLSGHEGAAPNYLALLTAAVTGNRLPVAWPAGFPSCITCEVPLPDITVSYLASSAVGATDTTLGSGAVWDVASMLAAQLGVTSQFNEYVSFLCSQLYSFSEQGVRDPIFSSTEVLLPLPPVLMQPYAAAPLQMALNILNGAPTPPMPNLDELISKLVVRNQILSASWAEAIYCHKLRQPNYSAAAAARHAGVVRRMLMSDYRNPIPCFCTAVNIARANAPTLSVSETSILLRPRIRADTQGALAGMLRSSCLWFEVADVVAGMPQTLLHDYIEPRRSTKLLTPNIWYHVTDHFAGDLSSVCRTLISSGAELKMRVTHDSLLQVAYHQVDALTTVNGDMLLDHCLPPFTSDDGWHLSLIFRCLSNEQCLHLHLEDPDERDYKWFVGPLQRHLGQEVEESKLAPPAHAVEAPILMPPTTDTKSAERTELLDTAAQELKTTILETAESIQHKSAPPKPATSKAFLVGAKARAELLSSKLGAGAYTSIAELAVRIASDEHTHSGSRSFEEYWRPLLQQPVAALGEVNLAVALSSVPKAERGLVSHAVVTTLTGLATHGGAAVDAKKLTQAIASATAVDYAVQRNPCVTAQELEEEGYTFDAETADTIANFATDLIAAGLPLSTWGIRTVNNSRWLPSTISKSELANIEKKWKKSGKTSLSKQGVEMAEYVPIEPVVAPKMTIEDAFTSIQKMTEQNQLRATEMYASLIEQKTPAALDDSAPFHDEALAQVVQHEDGKSSSSVSAEATKVALSEFAARLAARKASRRRETAASSVAVPMASPPKPEYEMPETKAPLQPENYRDLLAEATGEQPDFHRSPHGDVGMQLSPSVQPSSTQLAPTPSTSLGLPAPKTTVRGPAPQLQVPATDAPTSTGQSSAAPSGPLITLPADFK
jgi:hypothetical protein